MDDDNATAANEIDAWIAIDPDDTILIRYQRSEMGQGSMTALPMIVTEELHCDWSKVRIEYASPNRNLRENKVYGDMFSHGSQLGPGLAREDAAGRRQRTRAPDRRCGGAMECAGVGMHGGNERRDPRTVRPHAALWRAGRGCREDQAGAGAGDQDPRSIHLHRQADAARRRGAQDRRVRRNSASTRSVPGMVFAAINACPVPGGKLKSVDETALAGAPGIVQVVKLTMRWRWSRQAASGAPSRRWRSSSPNGKPAPPARTDSAQFSHEFRAALNGTLRWRATTANVDRALRAAAKTLEAIYETPYSSHAPMEPMNATVHLQSDRLDVWVGTQGRIEALKRRRKPRA